MGTTRNCWWYKGKPVVVAATADVPMPYRQGGKKASVVQMALNQVGVWERGESMIATVHVEALQPRIVVPLDGLCPIWAKHIGHHARRVQVSPFVELTKTSLTDMFTVELVGSSRAPRLVRAYPGGYTPPLPWQGSAEFVEGGIERCIEFWRCHAYVYRDSLVVPGSNIGRRAPSWYLAVTA